MGSRIYATRKARLFIADWREFRGLTQKQLGDRLGVASQTISRWETGERTADTDTLDAIAEALAVDTPALYRHPNQPSADELLRGQPAEVWDQAMTILKTIRRK
jgi:transcriptional regulator with XRE-family HTH domain